MVAYGTAVEHMDRKGRDALDLAMEEPMTAEELQEERRSKARERSEAIARMGGSKGGGEE